MSGERTLFFEQSLTHRLCLSSPTLSRWRSSGLRLKAPIPIAVSSVVDPVEPANNSHHCRHLPPGLP